MRINIILLALAFTACNEYDLVSRHNDLEDSDLDESDNSTGTIVNDDSEINEITNDCVHEYLWYFDADGDRYGASSPNSDTWSCDPVNPPGPGYVDNAEDCDDQNADVHPGAEEICDWIPDNNCDGIAFSGDSDGAFDSNGDGDYDDPGDWVEYGGADGFTWCFQYHAQIDEDGDGFCDRGMDLNGDGDCTDPGDILYAEDVYCPVEYIDCSVMDPNTFPGSGC